MDRSAEVAGPSTGVSGRPYSAISHFDIGALLAANLLSILAVDEVLKMPNKYQILDEWSVYHADELDLIYYTPKSNMEGHGVCVGVSERALYRGLRFPLLPILKKLFRQMGITLGQLNPNSFIHI